MLFNDVRKDSPGVAGVHVRTALGNATPRRATSFRELHGRSRIVPTPTQKRALHQMDAERSYMPLAYDPGALGSLRPDQVPRFLGALTDSDKLPISEVPIDSLVAMQNRVDTGKANHFAQYPQAAGDRLPVVVRAGGRHLIADGHHRIVGSWLRGDKTAKVRLKDLEEKTNVMKAAPLWMAPFKVSKVAPQRQMIFGWSSIVEKNGQPVIDKQDDIITSDALENAVYDYVLYSRDQGDMHVNKGVGRLIESMMFTTEKQALLGIDLGMVGHWCGFKVDDPGVWKSHLAGERAEFSIGGTAIPVEI